MTQKSQNGFSRLRFGVLGGGRLGQAFAERIVEQGQTVALWDRRPEARAELRGRTYGNGAQGAGILEVHDELGDVAVRSDILFVAIPARAFREVMALFGPTARPDHIVLHATKGVTDGFTLVHQVIRDETCVQHIGAIGGPILASEIRASRPQALVVGTRFESVETAVRTLLAGPNTWILGSRDIIGVEVAGAMRNVVAIAEGLVAGLGLGEPARALVAAAGLVETVRLGKALGAVPTTFVGMAGVGNLVARRESGFSRNQAVGMGLASGQTLSQILLGMGAENEPEGVTTARAAAAAAVRLGVNLPVTVAVAAIVGGASAQTAFRAVLDSGLQLGRGDSFV